MRIEALCLTLTRSSATLWSFKSELAIKPVGLAAVAIMLTAGSVDGAGPYDGKWVGQTKGDCGVLSLSLTVTNGSVDGGVAGLTILSEH